MKLKLTLAVAALATGLLPAAAYADSVTFNLTNPNGTASYLGGSVTYIATVSAPASNSAPVFLNAESDNFTGPGTIDPSDFYNNYPLSLAPGASFSGNLFVLTVTPYLPVGTFLGSFTLQGGANGGAQNTLGTVNFSLTTYVPEPSSIVLLLTGIAGLAMTLFWGKFKGNLRGWAR